MVRILILVLILALALPSLAVELRHGRQTIVIPKGQVIADDLVVTGTALQMDGTVNGDLVVAANSVRIHGPVMGDLIVAGGRVSIDQPVTGSVYVAGGTVDMNASVGRNVLVTGGTVNIDSGTDIARDLVVSGGRVTLAGAVGRNLRARARWLTLTSSAVIHGDLLAMTNRPDIMPGAIISGRQQIGAPRWRHGGHLMVLWWFVSHIYMGLALFIVGAIFLALAPRLTSETVGVVRTHPWASLLTGFIFLVVIPAAAIIAAMLLLGIPLALIMAGIYGTLLFLSPIFVAMLVGQRLLRRPLDAGGSYAGLFLGIVLLILLRLIPVLGGLVLFIITLLGLGALFLAWQSRAKHPLLALREATVQGIE